MNACLDCQRYESEPPRRRRRRYRLQPERRLLPDDYYGGEEDRDRLSALPDDLLLDVLSRLRCARAAARTSLVSRRWRGLWTRLPDLIFHTTPLDPLLAALTQIASPVASLNIEVPVREHNFLTRPMFGRLAPAQISPLLQAAAALAPARLSLRIWPEFAAVELPLFDRATCIELRATCGRFALPAAPGDFLVLDTVSLDCCHIDFADLLPRCPLLRRLWITDREQGSLTVHSESLEQLDINVYGLVRLQRIDIEAPRLKKLRLSARHAGINMSGSSLSFSAPALEDFTWQCHLCRSLTHRLDMAWCRCMEPWTTNLQTGRVSPGQNQLATKRKRSSVQLQR